MNNPVLHRDSTGNTPETVWDVISLGLSVADVIANPYDPWAWAGLVGDVVDVAVPFVGGVGEGVRALKVVKAVNLADVSTVKKGWSVGENITNLTKSGNIPKWSTVQKRYWKNEAYFHATDYSYENYLRMKKGLAPQVRYKNGKYYSMELHHKNPRRNGGTDNYSNLIPLSPWEHASQDPFRYFKP